MHYVAMAGTVYEVIDPTASPPVPALTTTALIAIIAAIVVVTCVVLLGIQIWQSKILLRKKTHSLVVIDAIYFDQEGKLLVKDDGTVPMKEIQADTENVGGPRGFMTVCYRLKYNANDHFQSCRYKQEI